MNAGASRSTLVLAIGVLALVAVPTFWTEPASAKTVMMCIKDDAETIDFPAKPRNWIVYTGSLRKLEFFGYSLLGTKGLRWRTWGGSTATARGRESRSNSAIRVSVYGRKRCESENPAVAAYAYTRVRIRFNGRTTRFRMLRPEFC